MAEGTLSPEKPVTARAGSHVGCSFPASGTYLFWRSCFYSAQREEKERSRTLEARGTTFQFSKII